MKLFLCSHFSSVGSLIKEEIENKKVAFIPTASLREGYTGYVGSARKLFKKLGAIVTEIDISTEAYSTIQSVFEEADVIYFTGGNSCNGVQREHNKKLNNGLPILHKVPPKRDYGRYFCIMAEKGGTSHGGLTEKLSPFFHAKKQEVNAYGR